MQRILYFALNATVPDTQLKKEGNVLMMHCTACGAKSPVKAKIA